MREYIPATRLLMKSLKMMKTICGPKANHIHIVSIYNGIGRVCSCVEYSRSLKFYIKALTTLEFVDKTKNAKVIAGILTKKKTINSVSPEVNNTSYMSKEGNLN